MKQLCPLEVLILDAEARGVNVRNAYTHIPLTFVLSEQEAVQCVEELHMPGVLPVFVQVGVESTLERSQITRDHMGQLLYQLMQAEKLSKQDFFKGLVVFQGKKQDLWFLFAFFLGASNKILQMGQQSFGQSMDFNSLTFFCRFADTLETADDMAIDIPHIWLYLAELVTPTLKEGGISMRELLM